MKYRREIDGLRAVAVLPVILFHAGFGSFAGGYVGVDVFFVISGYLITTILINDLEAGQFSLARFYERRARRILPALFFMMICCVPFAWMWMLPSQFKDFSQALVAVSLFASNILFWKKTDYFAPDAEENPLLHTWSLAVEEQFYIFFPILLWLLWRYGRERLFWVIVGLCVISLGASEWGWRNAPSANFYLIVTRAWELGAGAICAFLLHGRAFRQNTALSALGLGLIIFSIFAFDGETPFPSLYALAPVVGTALIILFAGSDTVVGRLLSFRAVVGVGLISYSAYLWHQPLFAFAHIRSFDPVGDALMLTLSIVSLGLGWLSWRYVERPFRHGGGALPRQAGVFAASAAGLAAFIGFGLYGHLSDGRRAAWLVANADRAAVYAMWGDARAERPVLPTDNACRFSAGMLDERTVERLNGCHDLYGPGLAVIGDSHARDLYRGYFQIWDHPFLFGMVEGGCRPYENQPLCDLDRFATLLEANPDLFSEIQYTQAGFHFLETSEGARGREIFRAVSLAHSLDPERYRPIQERIDSVMSYLFRLNEKTPVSFIGPRIEPHIPLRAMLQMGCRHDYTLRAGQEEIFRNLDDQLSTIVGAAGLTYVSQIKEQHFDLRDDFMTCDELYWADGDHWTSTGAARFVGRLVQQQAQILP